MKVDAPPTPRRVPVGVETTAPPPLPDDLEVNLRPDDPDHVPPEAGHLLLPAARPEEHLRRQRARPLRLQWSNRDNNSAGSNWRIGRSTPSIQVNWPHGLAARSFPSGTTPRPQVRPAFRFTRSKAAWSIRDHLSTVFGQTVASVFLLLGYLACQFVGPVSASRWNRAQSSGVAAAI
jgi:hypothetical protein